MGSRLYNISSMVTDVDTMNFLFTVVHMVSLSDNNIVLQVKNKGALSQFYLDCEKNKGKALLFSIIGSGYEYEFYNSLEECEKCVPANGISYTKQLLDNDGRGIDLYFVGFLLYYLPQLARYKKYLLNSWSKTTVTEAADSLDKIFIPIVFNFWEYEIYLREKNPDVREKQKSAFINDTISVQNAIVYDKRKTQHNQLFEKLKEYLSKEEDKLVIQIGSSCGRELNCLSKEFKQHEYIGTDISDIIVAYSNNKYSSNNLMFLFSYAHKIKSLIVSLSRQAPDYEGNMVIFVSGSLQYVQPEHVEIFFRDLGQVKNVDLFVSEPVFVSHLADGSKYRGDFAYTHNYKYYAEKNGIRTIETSMHEGTSPSPGVKMFNYIGSTRSVEQ